MRRLDPREYPRGEGRIRLELAGRTAQLIVDNPRRRNAVSPGMMVDLAAAVDRLQDWDGSALLIRGQGGDAFCAGSDVGAIRAHLLDGDVGDAMCGHMQDALGRLAALPVVIVAAVQGAAMGGGAELLTACDIIVASPRSRIGFVHASLGLSPGWGGGGRLVRRVGHRRALQILAFAQRMSAQTAQAMGLVDELADDPLTRAQEHVAALASMPAVSVRAAVRVARGMSPEQEREQFVALWAGPEHRRAMRGIPVGEGR